MKSSYALIHCRLGSVKISNQHSKDHRDFPADLKSAGSARELGLG